MSPQYLSMKYCSYSELRLSGVCTINSQIHFIINVFRFLKPQENVLLRALNPKHINKGATGRKWENEIQSFKIISL